MQKSGGPQSNSQNDNFSAQTGDGCGQEKKSYNDEIDAQIAKKYSDPTGEKGLAVYYCEACDKYHLTSHSYR